MSWVVAAVMALVVLFLWRRTRVYRSLYSDEHLIEVARAAVGIKAAAFGRIVVDDRDLPTPPADPRTALTSAGLAIVYTIRQDGSRFVHHCSISVGGGHTAHAVGALFGVLLAQLFALPADRTSFSIGASTVHHVQAVLDEAEHAALRGVAVPVITPENASDTQRATFEAGQQITWQRVGPPAGG